MLSPRHTHTRSIKRQQGIVALVLSMMLLVAVSLLLLGSARTGVMEQLIANNEYRALEANHAAQAALDYGFAWYGKNAPTWVSALPSECPSPMFNQAEDISASIPALATKSGDHYQLSVYLCRNDNSRKLIQVVAKAKSDYDGSINKIVKVFATPASSILAAHFSGAPLVVDGCLSQIKGVPEVVPYQAGDVVYETSQDLATASAAGSGGGTPPMTCAYANAFKADGGLNMNTGSVRLQAFTHNDVWRYTFGISKAEFIALANNQAATIPYGSRDYYYFSNNTPVLQTFHDSLGSATQPVIIVFDNDGDPTHPVCPTINGNITIWGIIFVNGPCLNAAASGWGDLDVYGSVVIAGDAIHLTANSNLRDWHINSPLAQPRLPEESLSQLLGTWSDF